MRRAIEVAENGRGKVRPNPLVGCVLVKDGEVIAEGWHDHLGGLHAEQMAIHDAEEKGHNTNGAVAYVTLEPCHMCAKAAVDARISSVIFAALEPKTGSLISIDNFFDKKELNHNPNFKYGLLKDESSKLLKDFFRLRR